MAGKIDNIINTSVATLLGIIMMCSVVIPIGVSQIDALPESAASYGTLVGVALTMAIVALIIGIVRYFSGNSKE